MSGAPGFFPSFRAFEVTGEIIEILKGIFDFDLAFIAFADDLFEFLFKILADDENDPVKAGTQGIKYRLIHHGFAGRAHRIELFQTSVTASHSGGEDQK